MKTTPMLVLLALAPLSPTFASQAGVSPGTADRLAGLALDCVQREYPNKISHVLRSDGDVAPPRELTPAFYGCFDWHSAVHAHWTLARLARRHPERPFADRARAVLDEHLTDDRIAREVAYLSASGREGFERPYGLAWLLQLAAELREWDDPGARRWSEALRPLESLAARRIVRWVPRLAHPIREGEHDQTAFAFGLVLDWARVAGRTGLAGTVEERVRSFYLGDRSCPVSWEPSGHDFLSPCLAEADVVRRVLPPDAFAAWLGAFLPGIPWERTDGWLPVARVTDRADGKLAHLDGLNTSRAWMLEGIAAGLPADDPRRPSLEAAAAAHRAAGVEAVTGEHYAGGHWLGTFATYLLTGRGLPSKALDEAEPAP